MANISTEANGQRGFRLVQPTAHKLDSGLEEGLPDATDEERPGQPPALPTVR